MQVDGQVWISDSVFQGGGRNCRAIDVNTADGGNPKLYAQGAPPLCTISDLAMQSMHAELHTRGSCSGRGLHGTGLALAISHGRPAAAAVATGTRKGARRSSGSVCSSVVDSGPLVLVRMYRYILWQHQQGSVRVQGWSLQGSRGTWRQAFE